MADFSEFEDGNSNGENVTIVDGSDSSKQATVVDSSPAGTEPGLIVRNIPSGTQNIADGGGSITVDGAVAITNASGAAAVNIQDGGNSITVDATSLPLPTGAATAANQSTEISSLSSIDTKLTTTNSSLSSIDAGIPAALGQTTMSASMPITIASNQTALPITDNGGSLTVDGTVELGATTLSALESITVQNGTGASAVNIQDGGNSITVDGTVSVSGSVAVTGPLTDTQLRATPVPISGTVTAAEDKNYGTVGANTIRSAAQIGNATGAADYNSGTTGAQTLRTVANQGASNTAANGWFEKITDGTDTVKVTTNQDLSVSDGLRNGGTQGALTLTTGNTAYEAKVGVSRLTNRKSLIITANDDMYWGYDNTVTTSTGQFLAKNQQISFSIDPDSSFQVWLVASANSKSARIAESP